MGDRPGGRPTFRERGFTLLELIGVLAVMAVLATVVALSLIKKADTVATTQESNDLQSLVNGLQGHIRRHRQIPDQTTWASNVAVELGWPMSLVSSNSRRAPRVYLIDWALRIGTDTNTAPTPGNSLPYLQTDRGSLVNPTNSRLMILSSLTAQALPMTSGVAPTNVFNDIWHTADGAVPTNAIWSGWIERGADLKIQRINLAPLFNRLILNNFDSPDNGIFSIDTSATNPVPASGISAFFIEGTVINMYNTNGTVEVRQILRRPATFVNERSVWRGQILEGLKVTGDDVYMATTLFLDARLNANAQNDAVPGQVVDAMTGYMTNYLNWDLAGFPSQPQDPAFQAVSDAQTLLANVSRYLIFKPAP